MSESYVDTRIVECSRLSSIDHQSGNNDNNAIFTNKVGSGIQLSVGDQVSVHTAMISEIGAGNETIELKGKSLGVRQTFKYTKKTPYNWLNYPDQKTILNYTSEFIQPVEEEIELQDNKANLLISYYKTLNCENCFSLPRRFAYKPGTNPVAIYEANDNKLEGTVINQIMNGQFIEEDYYRDRNSLSAWDADPRLTRQLVKVRQDGSKYTVMAREKTFYALSNNGDPELPSIPLGENGSHDPALDVYNRYVEKKEIVIPPGRRSADFIAETVTRQLQKGSDLKPFKKFETENNPDSQNIVELQGVLGATYQTDTFKLFTAGNGSNFTETNYDEIKNGAGAISQNKLDWYNTFQYIAVKRPDFIEKGRATRPEGGLTNDNTIITNVAPSNASVNASVASIELNYVYSEENCSRFSQLFKLQDIYPEFWRISENASSPYFSKENASNLTAGAFLISPENSRVLHLDMVQKYDPTGIQARQSFGSDLLHPTQNSLESIPSAPIFFVYDKSTENKFYGNPEYTATTTKLSYGAFTKGPSGNIQINTRGVGGIPKSYYSASGFFVGQALVPDYGGLNEKRFIGYDYHFTAYGNAAVGLWNGVLFEQRSRTDLTRYIEHDTLGSYRAQLGYTSMLNQYYMGATNPTLSFDTTKNRFGWSNLYTPERQGNNESAGSMASGNYVANDNPGTAVYKLNKRLRRQNFAPGMVPYSQEFNASIPIAGAFPTVRWDLPNKAVYPYSVMDSHSGIFINSFGFSEKNWTNGLFSILGFSYDQVQSPITDQNVPQRRINTDNISKLHVVTTEASVIGKDVLLYDQNVFGAAMEHPIVLPSKVLNFQGSAGYVKINSTWTNPINVESPSNIIAAERVPLQMLRPFYSIRSNLIDDTNAYLGSEDSGIDLPVMSVVSKSTTGGDFFIDNAGGVNFTITKPKVVTTITTSINDPDGSFSRVDDRSSVIYKITKNRSYPVDLLSTMFKN